jgi:hypothetical protein
MGSISEEEERFKNYLAEKLREGEVRMDKLDHSVDELKSDMAQVKSDLSSVLEVLVTMKAGVKYIGYIGAFIKWVGGIALGVTAIHALWDKLK